MKIVHVITRFILGGADENTLLTCNGFAEMGHEVILIFGNENHENIKNRLNNSVNTVEIRELKRNIDPYNDIVALLKLRKILSEIDADIVHTHESKAGVLARLALQTTSLKAKVIHGIHIAPFENVNGVIKAIYLMLERVAARNTDAFISVSEALKDIYVDNRVGNKESHSVVLSGMDVKKYSNAMRYSERELQDIIGISIAEDIKILLISGTLEPRKRVANVVNALAKFKNAENKFFLLIVGDGSDRERIEMEIYNSGMVNHAAVLGYRDDLERLIATSDICIHAAEHEGLPRVVIQYLAAKKPVVAMSLPGLNRVIACGANGYIIENSFEDFSEKIYGIISGKEKLSCDSKDLPRLDDWSHEKMVSDIFCIYQRVLSNDGL